MYQPSRAFQRGVPLMLLSFGVGGFIVLIIRHWYSAHQLTMFYIVMRGHLLDEEVAYLRHGDRISHALMQRVYPCLEEVEILVGIRSG